MRVGALISLSHSRDIFVCGQLGKVRLACMRCEREKSTCVQKKFLKKLIRFSSFCHSSLSVMATSSLRIFTAPKKLMKC